MCQLMGMNANLPTDVMFSFAGLATRADDAAARAHYEGALRALQPRYDLYERANRINAAPWLADLLIWRAGKSERLLRRMSGVLNETSNPGNLVSWRGLTRIIWE